MEEWVDIKGFPTYAVSTEGRVRHNRIGRYLIQKPDRYGYCKVLLTTKDGQYWFYVDELVARHFFRRYQENVKIVHEDGDPANNALVNLRPHYDGEWKTIPEAPGYEVNAEGEVRRVSGKRLIRQTDGGRVTLYERGLPMRRSAGKLRRELFGR